MGYPSVFNADMVIQEQMRVGKSLEDAREGGTSGCIETGCSGKEAYLLHGYLNVPKLLEYALSNGVDLLTGKQVSIKTGELSDFKTFDDLYAAFEKQMAYVVETKIGVDNYLRYQYATNMAATYLSCVINDCIKNGKDYYNGGPRYNSDYIQCCGIGTITDSLSAIKKHVYDEGTYTLQELVDAMKANWEGHEAMRLTLWNKTPFFGNDDDYADDIMRRVYDSASSATSTGSTASSARPTTSTCSRRPATTTSGRSSPRPRTDASAACPSPTEPARATAQTATARLRSSSRSARWTRSNPAERCSTSASCPPSSPAKRESKASRTSSAPTSSSADTTSSSTSSTKRRCATPRPTRTTTAASSSASRDTATTS